MTCSEIRTLLGGYVLHALEPDEDEAVRLHITTCAACAEEHAELIGIPTILDAAGPDAAEIEQPPAALEEAVLDRFAREHPRPETTQEDSTPARAARKRRRPRPLDALKSRLARPFPAALTGAVAAAAIAVGVTAIPGGTDDASAELYSASLHGTAAAPAATAEAYLKVVSSGTKVKLQVRNLRGTPNSVYELWCLRDDGGKVSAGTFRTDATGRADVNLTTAAVPGEYHRLGIERRFSNRPGEPVMAGEIEYPHS
jgi:Anti-sigma-K factor rskA/Putative zinc-finger